MPSSPPKPAPVPALVCAPQVLTPRLLFSFWISLQRSLTQLPERTSPLPKISSLQVLLLSGAFTSSGCCTAMAESLFSPNPLTLFCLVNAKDPGFFSGMKAAALPSAALDNPILDYILESLQTALCNSFSFSTWGLRAIG